jgi:hypothetical protein
MLLLKAPQFHAARVATLVPNLQRPLCSRETLLLKAPDFLSRVVMLLFKATDFQSQLVMPLLKAPEDLSQHVTFSRKPQQLPCSSGRLTLKVPDFLAAQSGTESLKLLSIPSFSGVTLRPSSRDVRLNHKSPSLLENERLRHKETLSEARAGLAMLSPRSPLDEMLSFRVSLHAMLNQQLPPCARSSEQLKPSPPRRALAISPCSALVHLLTAWWNPKPLQRG